MSTKLSTWFLILLKLHTTDWYGDQTIIIIETPDYPVENVPFPTITVCREDNNPNRFKLMENILNDVEFPCFLDQ